jgi:hypothetical protein
MYLKIKPLGQTITENLVWILKILIPIIVGEKITKKGKLLNSETMSELQKRSSEQTA